MLVGSELLIYDSGCQDENSNVTKLDAVVFQATRIERTLDIRPG